MQSLLFDDSKLNKQSKIRFVDFLTTQHRHQVEIYSNEKDFVYFIEKVPSQNRLSSTESIERMWTFIVKYFQGQLARFEHLNLLEFKYENQFFPLSLNAPKRNGQLVKFYYSNKTSDFSVSELVINFFRANAVFRQKDGSLEGCLLFENLYNLQNHPQHTAYFSQFSLVDALVLLNKCLGKSGRILTIFIN